MFQNANTSTFTNLAATKSEDQNNLKSQLTNAVFYVTTNSSKGTPP